MPSIDVPQQAFNITGVSFGDLTVTSLNGSNLANLYAGLIGYAVGPGGIPASQKFIVSLVVTPGVSSSVIRCLAAHFSNTGSSGVPFNFSAYNTGTIYFEEQLAQVNSLSNPGVFVPAGTGLEHITGGVEDPSAVTLTTADVADSANKRYCTDAQKTVISNTSGNNTGDKTLADLGGVPTTRTVNGHALSADIIVTVIDSLATGTVPAFVANAATISPGTDQASLYIIEPSRTLDADSILTVDSVGSPLVGKVFIKCKALVLGHAISVVSNSIEIASLPASLSKPRTAVIAFDGANFVFDGYLQMSA